MSDVGAHVQKVAVDAGGGDRCTIEDLVGGDEESLGMKCGLAKEGSGGSDFPDASVFYLMVDSSTAVGRLDD